MIHAPYRGGADAARDLAAGAIDAVLITTVSAGPIVDSGRARFLAVATLERVPSRPDVPTLAESGFPGFNSNEWAALFRPGRAAGADRRPAALRRLAEALADAGVKHRLGQIGAVPVGSAAGRLRPASLREGREQMAALVKEAGIRLD